MFKYLFSAFRGCHEKNTEKEQMKDASQKGKKRHFEMLPPVFSYLNASPGLVGMVEQNRSKALECRDFGIQLK